MSDDFWPHIEELRRRIIFLIALTASAAVVSFFFMDSIIQLLQTPMSRYDIGLYYREPPEKFFTYCKTSLACAMFVLIPAAAFQLARFVLPALEGKERKIFLSAIFSGIALFYIGAYFAWKFLIPFAVDFFINFARDDGVLPLWGISDYVGMVLSLMVVTGLSFEMPMFLLALLLSGIITVKGAARSRRYVFVAAFIVGAVVTPPDIFTQITVGLLLYGMFEITLFIARFIKRR